MTSFLILALCLHQIHAQNFVNDWDAELNFRCPPGEYISKMYSVHDGHHEDRRFSFECRSGFVGSNCYETDYVNSYDGDMNEYVKSKDAGLVGFYSVHNGRREDRIWKFRYCKFTNPHVKCKRTFWSGKINNYDEKMDYTVPSGYIILGAKGSHNNRREDRTWDLMLCEMAVCSVRGVTYDKPIVAKNKKTKVVGVQTAKGCSEDAEYFDFTFSKNTQLTDTRTISTSKTFSWKFEASISVKFSKKGSLFKIAEVQREVGVTMTGGVGGSKTNTKTTTTSLTEGSSGQTGWRFPTPKAALMIAKVSEYHFDEQDVPVTLNVHCDNGNSFDVKDTMSIAEHSFGHVHFSTITGVPTPERCSGSNLDTCLFNIEAQHVLKQKQIEEQFKHCVGDQKISRSMLAANGTEIMNDTETEDVLNSHGAESRKSDIWE